MDEIQILLYILFIVIAVLSRAFSKKKKQSQGQPPPTASNRPSRQAETPSKKPVSFEDLLREFTGEAETTTSPDPEYENDLRDEYEEKVPSFDDNTVAETYRKSIDQARDIKTLDETVDLEDIQIGSGRFDEFRIPEEDEGGNLNEYLEVFNDIEGSRKAIVLGEILQRKY